MNQLEQRRKEKDRFFASDRESPLTPDQKRRFKRLSYFPENPALRIEVEVEEYREKRQVEMQTTTGDSQKHIRWGRFRFAVDGKTAELTIYQSDHTFFLPFVDSLAGKQTYPAGRYLEPHRHEDGKFHIDFNQAYNPYCAYNDRWSCPIPPAENRLNVPIRAGEKVFRLHEHS